MAEHRFEAKLWKHHGDAGWHFVTVPADVSDVIAAVAEPKPFGSVAVSARIGDTRWETSLFPDRESGTYVLPVKRAVRDAEAIADGSSVSVAVDLGGGISGR